MRLDLLREQLTAEGAHHAAATKKEHARLARKLVEIDAALAAQIRGLEVGMTPTDLVGARTLN